MTKTYEIQLGSKCEMVSILSSGRILPNSFLTLIDKESYDNLKTKHDELALNFMKLFDAYNKQKTELETLKAPNESPTCP